MRRAKVVCTLGPASDDHESIRGLIDAGMSVARLNASHGSTAHRETVIQRVREASEQTGTPVATMLDISGQEIRTASVSDPLEIESGSVWRLVEGDTVHESKQVLGLSKTVTGVTEGDTILFDDGHIETTVERVDDDLVIRVDSGGSLGSRSGVNIPGVNIGQASLTESDKTELQLAAKTNIDYVAASFVGSEEDLYKINEVLEGFGADIPVIAKIERAQAVENLDDIIEAADGVMVARGDLGVECPLEQVPLIQKRIIRRATVAGIPVITATEMLDSMVHSRRPTRAEASDVANAILDGTDAVMLSEETAIGDHPSRVVETMDRIIRDVESSDEYAESCEQRVPPTGETQTDALARSARYLARDVDATAIVAVTESGYTGRKVAKYRPAVPIIAVTPDATVRRRLALTWGVQPRRQPFDQDDGAAEIIESATSAALNAGLVESGDTAVVLAGMMTELEGANTTNTLKVHLAAQVLASGRGVVPGRAAGEVFVTSDGDIRDCPDDAVVVLPETFDDGFTGDLTRIAAFVTAETGRTSHPAIIARELGVPAVGDVSFPLPDGTVVTVDGGRGVVYESKIPDH